MVNPSDPALILYTSGTTHLAKGVVLTHAQVVAALAAQTHNARSLHPEDRPIKYLSYLPLSHIFAFITDLYQMSAGNCALYGSPATLGDDSPGVANGERGDLTTAQPDTIITVPLVCQRIRRSIERNFMDKGFFS